MRTPASRHRTLRSRIIRTTAVNTAATVVGLAGWSLGLAVAGQEAVPASMPPESQGATVDRVQALMERHHCWNGPAPDGAEPTHALVTLPGERVRVVRASVGFGIWLDGDPGTVHAFCR